MNASARLAWRIFLAAAFSEAATGLAIGQSLHELIDQHLASVSGLDPALCSDAEFLRRASLDLIGMPPTADEARAFLADSAADKRQRLIDRLLALPQHVRHLAATLDVMLMERRANTHVSADEWQAWLLKSVRENKPWNLLAREILQADGDDPAQRAPARFYLDRASEPNLLTRDIGRIFFGRDLQCAQCHDHPIVEDYLQSDYHGLLAFVAPTYIVVRKEGDKEITLQAEKAGSDLTFESVFLRTQRRTGPRVPDDTMIDEPFFMPGEEYQVAPAENVKAVPKFSRRAKLAELATNGSNEAFNRNIVNRLWAHMFGRGLVHPLDWHHPQNPATHPELLHQLSERFVAMGFDIRQFLREVALSTAYQRAFDPPDNLLAVSSHAAVEVARLREERSKLQRAAKVSSETYAAALEAWQEAMLPAAGELDAARNQYAEAKQKYDAAVKAAADATKQLEGKRKVATPVEQAASAAQQAVQMLPEDKELAAAAAKFVARSQQLAAEVATLTKTAEDASAAVQPATEVWNGAKPKVEEARTKVTPLTDAMKQAEQTMLAARTLAARDAEALTALERRIATAKQVAKLPELQQAIVAAQELIPPRETELAATQQSLADYAAVVTENETKVKTATDALAAATELLNTAQAEKAKRTEIVEALRVAFESTNAARSKLPDDSVLVEVVAVLQGRLQTAQNQIDQSQQQVDSATATHQAATDALAAAQNALTAAIEERARREQAVKTARQALVAAQADVATKQSEYDRSVAGLTENWARDFTIATLKPLTPEQLCWSVFRVTGVYDRHWQAEVAELDKSNPLTDEQKQDAAQLAARDVEIEQQTYDKLKGNLATFVTFYGASAGQPQGDFFATADQALFTANGGSINSWVAPAGDNVTERVAKQEDLRVAAEELYLGVLTRFPTEQETSEVVAYLSERDADKPVAAQELTWSLLNSAEFRFNH